MGPISVEQCAQVFHEGAERDRTMRTHEIQPWDAVTLEERQAIRAGVRALLAHVGADSWVD